MCFSLFTRRGVPTCLVLLVLIGLSLPPDSAAQSRIELIVRPTNGATELQRILAAPNAKDAGNPLFEDVKAVRPVFPTGGAKSGGPAIPAYTVEVPDSTTLETLRRRWSSHDAVQYAQENGTFALDDAPKSERSRPLFAPHVRSSPANVFADSLDHLDVIRAREAQEVVGEREGVRIGILDTGIYLRHPDLAGQFWINPAEDVNGNGRFDAADLDSTDADGNGYVDDVIGYDFVDRPGEFLPGEFDDRDPDPSPDLQNGFSGHGTLVAGIAAASPGDPDAGVLGVAPRAQIVPLRAFGGDGRGQTDDIAAAIVYAANQGIDVVNMSFGRSRPAPLLREAIEYAFDRGTVFVASAGNNGVDDPHYPSDYPEVLSVVWLAEDGSDIPQVSRSQFGIGVDVGAPGTNVFTAQFPRPQLLEETPLSEIDRENLYANASGSSFSAPQVAGAAALVRSVRPDLSPAAVRETLLDSAADINAPGWDHRTGAGRLDVLAAVADGSAARTEIAAPAHDSGTAGRQPMPIIGSSLHPRFSSYRLFYARGTRALDERPNPWTPIIEPVQRRALSDTLARWDVSALQDGEYTLRLVTTLHDGTTVEDRRRIVVDRTPPELRIRFLGAGLVGSRWAVVSDLATDDDTRLRMTVRREGRTHTVESEFRGKRHGLNWVDERGMGGSMAVSLRAVNASGLTTQMDTSITVPTRSLNTAYLRRTATTVPRGRLLPQAPDFDNDGLRELILNQTENGGISDTLRSFEWGPSGFLPTDTLIADVIPRDLGDTDGDGLGELLTQVAFNTLLLEQDSTRSPLPTTQAFIDSTGRGNESGLIGTLLSDLDGDGNGEIVGNDQTHWKVLEWNGSAYENILQLQNPTSPETIDTLQNGNRFGTAAALDGDFDDDGRKDLLVGDRDGDWIVYESTGDASGVLQGRRMARTAWTFATDRVDAGDRFAGGDWDGDGITEFITYNTYFRLPLRDGDFEPPLSFYHVWNHTGDDAYERSFRLPIAGESAGGSLATADFDGDGRDEMAISHPPALYVLDYTRSDGWQLVFHDDDAPTIASRSLTASDFDGDGTPELMAATTGETLVRYRVAQPSLANPPPQWIEARPTGPSSLRLSWRASTADSVTVLATSATGAFDPLATTTDSLFQRTGIEESRAYALRAWRNGRASPLSEAKEVRPHAPAQVVEVTVPAPSTIRLRFDEPLSAATVAGQFDLDGRTPADLLFSDARRAVLLRFAAPVTAAVLQWSTVRDASGLPVKTSRVRIEPPTKRPRTLIVESATVVDSRRVRLVFSDPLSPETARNASNYEITPRGNVESVRFQEATPSQVELRVSDIVVGATGLETSLTVTAMRSAKGAALAPDGSTVALNQPAEGLDNVFVYPNPYRAARHGESVTIAGLPREATLRILSPDGRFVREVDVTRNGSGGVEWNLRDQQGELVPSGIYLIRVEAPESEPVLKKAAVIR